VICTHGWSALAVHALGVPANVTVTSCGGVTDVSAPAAPAFVAPKCNDDGVAIGGVKFPSKKSIPLVVAPELTRIGVPFVTVQVESHCLRL
jgi:hypothetical protein